MIYKNMREALQDNAYAKFKERWGVEPHDYHLKEWCEIRGWVTTSSISICSKQQYNVASFVSSVTFKNDILVIERDDFTITLTPKGYATISLDRVAFDEIEDINNTMNYFKEMFEKCR